MISLRSVSFRYGDSARPALDGISLDIATGDRVAVMGRNGCGKSTLAHLISNLIKPSNGEVRIGQDNDNPVGVGLLFQNPDNQFVALTVEKEIAFALENAAIPMPEMRERVETVLAGLGIAHLKGRLINSLSGGEKQRVALAGVMIANPSVLLLDEPDSYLDAKGREMLENQLGLLREKNPDLTELRITQYPDVARKYERLIVLDRGEILADDYPAAVLGHNEVCSKAGLTWAVSGPDNATPGFFDRGRRVQSIEFSELSFGYPGGSNVIQDLSLTLHAGEILCVVGPSGSGKTTLSSLLTSLLQPSSGRISRLDELGNPVVGERGRGRVTASMQMPERQFFLESCSKEIEYGPSNFGRKLSREQIEKMFSSVGLEYMTFADREPLVLSTGEKRRLAFAVVMALDPDFIVFDEPGCGLDPEGVGNFISLARQLKTNGLGLVVITHDKQVVAALADRVLVLDEYGQSSLFSGAEYEQERLSGQES
ncbi:MAG: ATP-binding cassette domain-containing protein [bacterium]|nr:ATP-binding cassette domain-containing protein [bacterium]